MHSEAPAGSDQRTPSIAPGFEPGGCFKSIAAMIRALLHGFKLKYWILWDVEYFGAYN